MELFKNPQEFNDAIVATSSYFHLSTSFVEKDYYITYILKELNNNIPGLLFRGGTSLSKCFKVINRFSEDIDLTLDVSHYSYKNKINANKSIIKICNQIGFEIMNLANVDKHSHGNYNCYLVNYPISYLEHSLKPSIKIEMTFIQKTYPDLIKPINSLIADYLIAINQSSILPNYNLEPFTIRVQSLERTFVDKVFALCDYYLSNQHLRQSRHLYDLFKLMKFIEWKNLKLLINDVRFDRQKNKRCLSAQSQISIINTLQEIIDSDFYKHDFNEVTLSLVNEKVTYEDVVSSINEIIQSSIFS